SRKRRGNSRASRFFGGSLRGEETVPPKLSRFRLLRPGPGRGQLADGLRSGQRQGEIGSQAVAPQLNRVGVLRLLQAHAGRDFFQTAIPRLRGQESSLGGTRFSPVQTAKRRSANTAHESGERV